VGVGDMRELTISELRPGDMLMDELYDSILMVVSNVQQTMIGTTMNKVTSNKVVFLQSGDVKMLRGIETVMFLPNDRLGSQSLHMIQNHSPLIR